MTAPPRGVCPLGRLLGFSRLTCQICQGFPQRRTDFLQEVHSADERLFSTLTTQINWPPDVFPLGASLQPFGENPCLGTLENNSLISRP